MRRAHIGSALLVASGVLGALGCTSVIDGGKGPGASAAGAGNGAGGAAPSGGSGGGPTTTACKAPKPAAQRIVRLTFAQLQNSIQQLLGPDALKGATTEDPRRREFQALFVEGDLVNTQVLQKNFSNGEIASGSIADKFSEITGCPAGAADDTCANAFIARFAESAYRRPLLADEKASLAQLYTDTKAIQGTVADAVRSTVLGILTAPEALYRTEIGAAGSDPKTANLTGYEIASSLSYFLMNGPPDAALLAAAAAGKLGGDQGIGEQVDRLLQLEPVKQNLTAIITAYYGLKDVDGVVKDPGTFPDFNTGVRSSMYTETQLFIDDTLRNGKVSDLMTSRKSFINDTLAKFYGVTYPAATGTAFLPFEFPEGKRAGLLTHGSILTTRARTDTTSVVARGLFINGTVLCVASPPPPPAAVQAQVDMQLLDKNATERDKAHVRDTTPPCSGCHLNFDAYGLVLENFDGIGRLRTTYPNGTPIDTTGDLPLAAGGGTVPDVFGFVKKVTENGAFSRCLTNNLIKYALADATLADVKDCNVQQASQGFQASDGSFPSLIRQIANTQLLSTRTVESTP